MKTQLCMIATAAIALFGLTSCFQVESTISVKKDGSGTVTEETILGEQMKMMLEMAAAQGGQAEDPMAKMLDKAKAEARAKKMGELAVGNVIGANILNILWVLGCSSLVNPLTIDNQTKKITIPVLFVVTLFLFIFARTKFKLSRNEGLILLAIYLGYTFYIFKFAYI